MLDRHLVTDVAIAAAIVLPAALPPTPSPRAPETQLVNPAPSPPPGLAEYRGGLKWGDGTAVQGARP